MLNGDLDCYHPAIIELNEVDSRAVAFRVCAPAMVDRADHPLSVRDRDGAMVSSQPGGPPAKIYTSSAQSRPRLDCVARLTARRFGTSTTRRERAPCGDDLDRRRAQSINRRIKPLVKKNTDGPDETTCREPLTPRRSRSSVGCESTQHPPISEKSTCIIVGNLLGG